METAFQIVFCRVYVRARSGSQPESAAGDDHENSGEKRKHDEFFQGQNIVVIILPLRNYINYKIIYT